MSAYLRKYREVGWRGLLAHLYTMKGIKEGALVGRDALGNRYFENRALPYGQHRWYEPPTMENPNLHEASSVPPDWHGWLHSTHDAVPASGGPPLERTGPAIIAHSDASYRGHAVGHELREPWRPNPTLRRERGYGVKTYQSPVVGENAFYTQPGHPLSPVYAEHRRSVEAWSPDRTAVAAVPKDSLPPSAASKWALFQAKRDEMNAKEGATTTKRA